MQQQIIAQLPVGTISELARFEKEMSMLTAGFSLRRSMSYSVFRISVLQAHQTGSVDGIKCILMHNHFISTNNGIATLYRNFEESQINNDGDDVDDDSSDETPKKRVKRCGV